MVRKKKKEDPFKHREAEKYTNPIPSREYILEHLIEKGLPENYFELLTELNVEGTGKTQEKALQRRLKAMVRDGQLERLRGGYFWPSSESVTLKGKIIRDSKKTGWLLPEDGSHKVFLSADQMQLAANGDLVIATVLDLPGEEYRLGKILEVVSKKNIEVSGRYMVDNGVCYVIPHGNEVKQDILIPPGKSLDANDGDIVVAEIEGHATRSPQAIGKILEVLGNENTKGIEMQAAIRSFNLPYKWSDKIKKQIEKYSEEVSSYAKRGRLDLRELPFVTIDGEDAKDFDDAVYCEPKKTGGWTLYVAIADVSYYVKPNTALDIEAKDRGTSVYFPSKVIPMLPEILSNGLCSLKPEVDRLALVCIMSISKNGVISKYEFHNAIIKSHARLTYTIVASILNSTSEHLESKYSELLPQIHNLHSLYLILRKIREERGAIDFDTVETKIIFSKKGKIQSIKPVERNVAHKIIEECMLCANVATARFLKKNKIPGLYRNHHGPKEDKVEELREFLSLAGISLSKTSEPTPLDYAKVLRQIKNRPDFHILQMRMLRSLTQASYSKDNAGHFGLAYKEYAHFTSPIRRYPDLLVHTQIKKIISGNYNPKSKKEREFSAQFDEIALHCSMTERRADEAVRDVEVWLKCQYINKHIGESFEAVISGVTNFGFFAELKEIYVDGLVHVSNLNDDYYTFNDVTHKLTGERSGKVYQLGDTVHVVVARVDIDERKIDFIIDGSKGRNKKKKDARTLNKKESKKKDSKVKAKNKSKFKKKLKKKAKERLKEKRDKDKVKTKKK